MGGHETKWLLMHIMSNNAPVYLRFQWPFILAMARNQDEKMPIVVFPEGTSTIKGPVANFKSGSFESAKEALAPIQPVTIWYSEPIGMNR